MRRRLELLHMLRGLRNRIRHIRTEVEPDAGPYVSSRLWNAEMQVRNAEEATATDAPPDKDAGTGRATPPNG